MNRPTVNKIKIAFLSGFPVTLLSIWLFTILFSVFLVYQIENETWESIVPKILFFLFFYGCGSFALEAFFFGKRKKTAYAVLLSANLLPAVIWTFFWYRCFENSSYSGASDFWYLIDTGYFFFLFFLGVFFCFKNLHCSFYDYLVRIFGRTIRYHITYFILALGSSMIMGIAIILFGLSYEIFFFTQMLLFGFYYVSSLMLSFSSQKEETSFLTAGLIRYILSVLVLLAFFIIYGYMLMVLIQWNIPSNAVYRIISGLFIFALPVCLMNKHYRDVNFLSKVVDFFPVLFSPFWFLQAYSLFIRIVENGITPLRYTGIFMLVFEALVIVLYLLKKDWLPYSVLLLSAISFFTCLLPYANANYISYYNQKAILERYLSLSEEKKTEIIAEYTANGNAPGHSKEFYRYRGAYSYLKFDYLGESYLSQLSPEEIASLDTVANASYNDNSFSQIYGIAYLENESFSVEGYQTCKPCYYNEETTPPFNADNLLREHLNHNDEGNDYLESHHIYPIDKNHTFVMTYLSYTYEEETDTFSRYILEGYLLEKY